jgi:hypothetical protein
MLVDFVNSLLASCPPTLPYIVHESVTATVKCRCKLEMCGDPMVLFLSPDLYVMSSHPLRRGVSMVAQADLLPWGKNRFIFDRAEIIVVLLPFPAIFPY